MSSTLKTQTALKRRREKFLARYSESLQALASLDVARENLEQVRTRRDTAEKKALARIAERYVPQEEQARVTLAEHLANARAVMGAKEIADETGLSVAEQRALLDAAEEDRQDNDSDKGDERTSSEEDAQSDNEAPVAKHAVSDDSPDDNAHEESE